jgi:hypothetical protein
VGLDDLAERPERDAVSVGQAPSLAPRDELLPLVVDVGEELGDHAALADPRLAHDRHELARAIAHRALEQTAK